MLDTNHNHSSCGFAEQIISRLYGETNQAEDAAFETHLKTCFVCADELANFGSVRSSVLEWRREEFFEIETPTFEIPVAEKSLPAISNNSFWLDKLRRAFSLTPVLATASLTALLVCFGLALLFALNSSKNSEVAGTEKNSKLIVASPTAGKLIKKLKENSNGGDSENTPHVEPLKPTVASSKDSQPETVIQKRLAPKNTPIKVSDNPTISNPNNVEPARIVKGTNRENKKSPSVRKPKAPTLTTSEEEEDTTVRLADLFDELDTKK